MLHSLETRAEAVGMIKAGKTIKDVSKAMDIAYRTIQNWWARSKKGESLKTKQRCGRPKILSKRAKIIIAKSVGKRRQSTRKLAKRLTGKGDRCSKNTVHRYLKNSLGLKSFKRQKIPKLSEKNIKDRYQFAKMARKLTPDQWQNVIFSDESPFPLFWSPNKQVDRIWAKSPNMVEPSLTVKKSPGIQVWGAMSATGLSDLYVMPQNFRLNAESYKTDILEAQLKPILDRKAKTGVATSRKLVENRLDFVFQHDGAPAHFARSSETWLDENVPKHWGKGVWPGNSPDLNPIENLWAILKDKLDCQPTQPQNLVQLEAMLKDEWNKISPETLQNLIHSMPSRVEAVYKSRGYDIVN